MILFFNICNIFVCKLRGIEFSLFKNNVLLLISLNSLVFLIVFV